MPTPSLSKHLFKGTFVLTLGAFLRKGVNFLLLPLYTSALAASGYGTLAMLTVFGSILTMCLNFGLGSALTVKYHELVKKGKGDTAIHTVISFLLFVSLGSFILLFFTAPYFSRYIVKERDAVFLIRLYLVTIVANILIEMFYVLLRLKFLYTKQLVLSLLHFSVSTSLIVTFVLVFKWGLRGVLLGMVIPSMLILTFFFINVRFRLAFDKDVFSPLFKFGIWLVPGNLGALIYTSADRFFIQEYFSSSEVGIYSVAVKLSSMITVFALRPFRRSFGPYVYQQGVNFEHAINLGLKFLLIICGVGFLGIGLAGKPIVSIMTTPEFLPAVSVIPILLLVEIMNALNNVIAVAIHRAGKPYIASSIVWVAAALNIGLNFLFIPRYKILGAAVSTLITYIIMMCAFYYFSIREMRYRFDFRFIAYMITAVAIYYCIGTRIINSAQSILTKLVIFSSVIGCYLITVFLMLNKEDKVKIISFLYRKSA